MRVLLIQAPLGRNEKAVYPLGLSYIAGSIADKHEFTVLDANLHSRDEIEARLINFKPDLIGIGLRNIDTTQSGDPYFYFQNFPPFIKWIKCLSNNSLIVVGGSGFSMFPYEVMMACPEIDLGVNLEGEKTFPVLLDNLNKPEIVPNVFYRNNNKIIYSGFSELPDFALIGAPPRIIDPTRYQDALYQLGVQTKRGCTHRCLYCNYPALNGHRMRLRHPIDVVDELQVLVEKHGIGRFCFSDGTFNDPIRHASEICSEMLRRNLKLKWGGYFSMRGFDQSFFKLATEAGCELFTFSPDGLTQPVLDALQKEITEEQISQVMELFKSSDYPNVFLCIMFNAPGAKLRDLVFMLRAVLYWPLKYPSLKGVSISNMRIYPDTPLQEYAIKNGVIDPDQNLFRPLYYDPGLLRSVHKARGMARFIRRRITGLSRIILSRRAGVSFD